MRKFEIRQTIDLEVLAAEMLELWQNKTIGDWLMLDNSEHWFKVVLNVDKKYALQSPQEFHQTVGCPMNIRIHRTLFEVDGLEINCYGIDHSHKLGVLSLEALITGCTLMAEKCPTEWGRLVDGDGTFTDYEELLRMVVYKDWKEFTIKELKK